MSFVLSLGDDAAASIELTGGKGSSLARLVGAGFPVPPGFVVNTDAYKAFVEQDGLNGRIASILETIDYDNPSDVEEKTAEIRAQLEAADMPAELATATLESYKRLGGDEVFVAVRSSGTAEDLEETSFAGQHDTYLDIRGEEDLLAAVRRCWASLWTARATAYRQKNGFAHDAVSLAVVVQTMIESEVSGVMFTANPVSTAIDEFVINASYGLGEAIVGGIVTPDQFTIDRDTYEVVDRIIGPKAKCVIRDPEAGKNTIVAEVDPARRAVASLDDEQITQLGRLGAKVTEYNDGWPQDVEWALADGQFYLLQSRDVTGVEFSWDEDLDDYQPHLPRTPRDVILSRAFSDSVWQGRITPMGYSLRGEAFQPAVEKSHKNWGSADVGRIRLWKYRKGEVYMDGRYELGNALHAVPPALRSPELLGWTPPSYLEELEKQPGSWLNYPKALLRLQMMDPDNGAYRWFKNAREQWNNNKAGMLGPTAEELQEFSDRELALQVDRAISNQVEWVEDLWSGFFLHISMATSAFAWMLKNWYRGDDPMIFTDLVTGLPEPTITLRENTELWEIAELIRNSEELTRIFEENPGAAFFEECRRSEAAEEFLQRYGDFIEEFGHRGHADRDISYMRRSEDPSIDYNSLKVFLSAEMEPPGQNEEKLIARRNAVRDEVLADIASQPFGAIKCELFKMVHDWILKFFVLRDDERHHTDRGTWAKKKAVEEVGRRLAERGVLDAEDDFYYLSKNELMRLFDGGGDSPRLTKAKVAARRRNVEEYMQDGTPPPMYILGNGTVTTDGESAAPRGLSEDGVLRGVGTSRGEITGTARVIPEQKDLHRVEKGDILITRSTDPGWTTVFLIISGLVLETGGMTAHGACISREYGLPAVQVDDAMQYIKDGATITVNGDTGEVTIVAEPEADSAAEPERVAG